MSSSRTTEAAKEREELSHLHLLDELCTQFQQQGNYRSALDEMEKGLVLRRHLFGAQSDEVYEARISLSELSNVLALTYLQEEKYPIALELLKKAHILSEIHPPALAATLNNMACYYRRLGKLHASLSCLRKALKLENEMERNANVADTHINICAVQSELGQHHRALQHAKSALILLQEELLGPRFVTELQDHPRLTVLCIAYHNVGAELEHLRRFPESVDAYRKGTGLSERYLGPSNSISDSLKNSLLSAKRQARIQLKHQKPKVLAKRNIPRSKSVKTVVVQPIIIDEPDSEPSIEIRPALLPHDAYFSPRASPFLEAEKILLNQ